jgi:hypothetical protein
MEWHMATTVGKPGRLFTRIELDQLKQVSPHLQGLTIDTIAIGFEDGEYLDHVGFFHPLGGDGGRKKTCSDLADPSPTKRDF